MLYIFKRLIFLNFRLYSAYAKCFLRYVCRNGGSRGDKNIVADFYRGYKVAVTAYKAIVADIGFMLVFTVIIGKNHAAAYIAVFAYLGVAHIS